MLHFCADEFKGPVPARCASARREKPAAVPRLRRLLGVALLSSGLAFGNLAQGAITFSFDFGADNDLGFWDPNLGLDRQAALVAAGTGFSSMFGGYFSNSATVLLQASADTAGSLASLNSKLFPSPTSTPGFTVADVVKTKLQGGVDLNGATADGVLNVNFATNWQLGLNAPVASGQFDFYGVVYHEFTHALGFYSTIQQNGDPRFGTRSAGQWGAFDQFLVDNGGARVVNPDFSLNQVVWDAASDGGASPAQGLFFDGTFASLANGGKAVGLYSPTTWLQGSSASHLDTDNPALAGSMMLHTSTSGRTLARNYSAIEVGMLHDLGYSVNAVPEPASVALLLAGLLVVTGAVRRSA